jgi:parallel beta-helix repeat protein
MLINSHKCSLTGNEAVGNEKGIALSGSNACTISKNNASANQMQGLSLEQLSGAEIQENAARFNGQGLFVQSSSKLLIQGNNLSENSRFGLRMSSTSASNVTLNSFVHNQFSGANLVDCKGNFLYHNIFIENGIQNAADNGTNQWDAGPIAGGNYWSDHAVQGNPGNVPRQIPSGGVDRYPFQDLWGWR